MKPCILIFLLLLSVLLQESQGLRLIKRNKGEEQQHIHEINHGKGNINDGAEEGTLCKTKHCSGRTRKLNMIPISKTGAKKDQKLAELKPEGSTAHRETERNEDNLSAHSSSLTEQKPPESHQDVLDIAGMDYSQATRKPPIHN